jgi:hypothetical protein
MPTKDRREARTFSQTVPPLPPSDHFKCKWKKIQASTAKCDVCGKRNTKGSMVHAQPIQNACIEGMAKDVLITATMNHTTMLLLLTDPGGHELLL